MLILPLPLFLSLYSWTTCIRAIFRLNFLFFFYLKFHIKTSHFFFFFGSAFPLLHHHRVVAWSVPDIITFTKIREHHTARTTSKAMPTLVVSPGIRFAQCEIYIQSHSSVRSDPHLEPHKPWYQISTVMHIQSHISPSTRPAHWQIRIQRYVNPDRI